jgi:tetratricopeptide (TPR) repeat protein
MKLKQPGGPILLVHRCFFVLAALPFALLASPLRGEEAGVSGLQGAPDKASRNAAQGAEQGAAQTASRFEDFAQVYVDQFFEPTGHLTLSEQSRRKGRALAHYALGRSLEAQGRAQEAVEAYAEVLRNDPGQFVLARKTAYLLARAGRVEEAMKLLEDSLARHPDEAFVHIALSEFIATYEGNLPEGIRRAFEIAEGAVERFPDDASVYEHLVKLHFSADRRDEARRLVAKAAQSESKDPEFWLRLGRLATRTSPAVQGEGLADSELVNAIYEKALDRAGDDLSLAEKVGDYYLASGQHDLAVAVFFPLVEALADRIDLRMKLAQAFAAKGDEEKLIETLEGIVAIDPQNADVHKQIAGIYLRSERYKEAIPHVRASLAITKGSAEEYGALARMMLEAGEEEEAIAFLDKSAQLFPETPEFPLLMTFILGRLERWEESVKQFERTVELARDKHPHVLNETFYFRFAAAVERSKDFDRAEELFRKTIEMIAKNDPEDENQEFTATVYNYLGYMWLENDKNIDEAGELIKTAAELQPESGAIADSLGWFHFKKGRYEEARDELLRAETLMEKPDPVVYDHLGQAFFHLGEFEKAVDYLEQARELEPENEEYRERLEEYRKAAASGDSQ